MIYFNDLAYAIMGAGNPECAGTQQAWRLMGVDATVLSPIFSSPGNLRCFSSGLQLIGQGALTLYR